MNHLIFEQSGGIGILKVNRPTALNALNQEVLEEMLLFLEKQAAEEGCKAIILTGQGDKSFIAGADIKAMQTMTHVQMLDFCKLGQRVSRAFENAPCLTIAAVNGYALGGGLEMALACDFIYAAKNAKLGLPEVSLGIIPGFGGTQRLARAVGTRFAKEMIMSGKSIVAEEAKILGIVNKVCEPDFLLKDCQSIASEIIRHSSVAVFQAKRAIDGGYNLGMGEALELERNMCAVCFATDERVRGMAAFLEKRSKG